MELSISTIITIALAIIGVLAFLGVVLFSKKKSTPDAKLSEPTALKENELVNWEKILTNLEQVSTRQLDQKTDLDTLRTQIVNLTTQIKQETGGNSVFKTHLKQDLTEIDKNLNELKTKLTLTDDRGVKLTNQIQTLNQIFLSSSQRGASGELSLNFILHSILGNNSHIVHKQYKMQNKCQVDVFLRAEQTNIPIDSKFPEINLTKENTEPNERKIFIANLKRRLKKHVNDLEKYISREDNTEQVLMYLPSQALFDLLYTESEFKDLHDLAYRKKVTMVGPNTLPVVLRIVIAFVRDVKEQRHLERTLKLLRNLQTNWERFDDRWEKTQKRFEAFTNDLREFDISTRKISGKLKTVFDSKLISEPIATSKLNAVKSNLINPSKNDSTFNDKSTSINEKTN